MINIEEKIEEFRATFLGENWVWRKGQIEAITTIIETYLNKSHSVVILSSPVGSGKSIIVMCASWIFNQMKLSSYILTSEISLQEQYENDFKKFNLNWGSIKGTDRYECINNFEKNSLGTCRIRNKAPKSFHCYNDCPYFSARDKASQTQSSLLNYSYWLIQQNYVNERFEESLFRPRPILFADEAHKISDIIQNHFSPRITDKTIDKLEKLTSFFDHYRVNDHKLNFQSIKINIKQLYQTENQDKLFSLLCDIELNLEAYKPSWELLKEKVKKEHPKNDPPKEWKEALRLCDWLKDFHCKIEDYVDIIENTSTRNIVKNPGLDKELVFNCLEESYLIHKYFHKHYEFVVLTSATFGDPSEYIKSLALKNAKYIKVDNLFDYSKSPIYFYNKHRMSYKEINNNLPWLINKVDEILDKHENVNGLIHSVSFDLAMKIFNGVSKKNKHRILVYNGTEEKMQVLNILKQSKNKVLIGPSLITGIDLKNDFSRFCIFAKTPYMSLSDNFVKAKMQNNPKWYAEKTIIDICQGIGRAIRNENDWAVTYYLDATLSDLLFKYRKSFPEEFIKRIITIND
jgi:ATP-dependent DNA helicase DinG